MAKYITKLISGETMYYLKDSEARESLGNKVDTTDSRLSDARPASNTVDTYSSTGTNPVSGKAVAAAIGTLDVSSVGGTNKYIKTISETNGKISATAGTVDTSVTANSSNLITSGAVKAAIDALPEPMVFKGSLGTGGTVTSLPTAAAANKGFTYKVITAGTYASQAAKVGDTFISDGSSWVLIPSGDEPSGTVTSVTIKATSPISIDSSAAITSSGTRTISHAASGVTAGTYKSVTVDAKGHVTAGTNPTKLSGYGITDAAVNNLLTNEDLNNVKTPGFYNASGGNTVTNKPSNFDAFGLEVIHSAAGNYYVQIIYACVEAVPYRRYCNNGTWSSWVKDKLTDTTYSAGSGLSLSGTTFSLALTKALVTTALGYTPPTTNTTYSAFTGAKADADGTAGLVPAPAKGKLTSFLRGDGTWVVPSYLPLSGGYVSNNINLKGSFDLTKSNNNTENTIYPSTFNIVDSGGRISARLESIIKANGENGFFLYVRQYNANGETTKQEGLQYNLPKTGNGVWTVSNPSSFRTALGLGARATDSTLYLPLSGGTLSNSDFGKQLIIERSGSTNMAAIGFKNSSGILGYLATNTVDGAFVRYNAGASTNYTILDSSNSSVSKSGETLTVKINGTSQSLTNTNTTYSDFVKSGASAAHGLVPKPSTTAGTTHYLREDGTWQVPPDTNTTYSNMTGATADANGTAGLVPAPAKGKLTSFLRGDGTWVVPTNTTYSDFVKSGSSAAHGLVPKPSTTAGTTHYLREDGTWTVPPNTTYSNFVKSGSGAKAGLVPAPSTTAGTTKYLREDGTWSTPPDNNTTYSNMTAATASAAGKAGLVPAPAAGKLASFLRGDGTWVVPTNTTYSAGTGLSLSGTKFSLNLTKALVTDALGYTPPTTNTWTAMTGATASANGTTGYVSATPPKDGYNTKFLRADNTWAVPTDTNTDTKVTTTVTEPTSAKTWYPICTTSSSTVTGTTVSNPTGFWIKVLQGTAAAGETAAVDGYSYLYLGNSIATGTAGNKTGGILLYNNKGKLFGLFGHVNTTSNRTLYLPDASGTLVAHTTNTAIGSTTEPVYISAEGVATAIGHTIAANVPSGAVFTDNKVTQTSTTTDADYEVLLSSTADNTTRTEGARKTSTLKYNPSTTNLSVYNEESTPRITLRTGLGTGAVIDWKVGATDYFQQHALIYNNTLYHEFWSTDNGVMLQLANGYGVTVMGDSTGFYKDTAYEFRVCGKSIGESWNNTSDVRLKNITSNVDFDVEDIANAPLFKFTWIDPNMGDGVNVGTSAQYWETVVPELITKSSDDMNTLSMQYGVTGLASAIVLARKVVEQEETIKSQEQRIKALEDAIAEIKNLLNN